MRVAFTLLAVAVAWFAARQPRLADETQEKERRDRLEKSLAEWDRLMESTAEARQFKKLLAELKKELGEARRIDLLRLGSRPLAAGEKREKNYFHGYEILTEARAGSDDQRKEVVTYLGGILHWNTLRRALCFNPRHGLRAVCGARTLDFVICFECSRIQVFDGEKYLAELPLGLVEQDNAIERFLQESERSKQQK